MFDLISLPSRSGPKEGTRVTLNDTTNLAGSDFKPSRKTKFIAHGWKSSAMSAGLLNMKEGTVIYFPLVKIKNYISEIIIYAPPPLFSRIARFSQGYF